MDRNQYVSCRAVNTFQSLFYDPILNRWSDDGGWWNTANSVEALVNYCDISNLCDEELMNEILRITDIETIQIKNGL